MTSGTAQTFDRSVSNKPALTQSVCNKARLARDARFDGLFFTGVRTTGIFCRSICPATPPKETNVTYYATALGAAQAGLRPCLRCRPEAAPGSPAWRGAETTLIRAVRMIDDGEWGGQSLPQFAERLGVSDRYLRKLFQQHLGTSPKKYVNFRRTLFAKQLLQQTTLPVTEVARIAGFGSTRRFNTVFAELMGLNPRQLRRSAAKKISPNLRLESGTLVLFLSYRPPYDWAAVREFYRARQIAGLEVLGDNSYSRSFSYQGSVGWFTATHRPDQDGFGIELALSEPQHTLAVVQQIRRLLDLDADTQAISRHLAGNAVLAPIVRKGLRLPGMWAAFEAGTRAILGQQVSVKAAHNMVTRLVNELGVPLSRGDDKSADNSPTILFPEPAAVARSKLEFLAMPDKRRQALRLLARHVMGDENRQTSVKQTAFEDWLAIPGIGPWTVQYAAFRMGNPDIFLLGDLGVKNALKKLKPGGLESQSPVSVEDMSPWGSYATLLLWESLSADPQP